MQSFAEQEFRDIIKIILVGDAGTGKTNMIYSFTRQKIPNNIMPTIAVEFSSKLVTISNQVFKTQIWDTAGQETYRSLTMSYYRRMNGAVIVYDVAKRTTFEHVRYWLQNIREKGDVNVQICLIGHKTDQSRREVSAQQAEQFALRENIMYAQTSIKDAASISNAFKKFIMRKFSKNKKQTIRFRTLITKVKQISNSIEWIGKVISVLVDIQFKEQYHNSFLFYKSSLALYLGTLSLECWLACLQSSCRSQMESCLSCY